MNDFPASTDPAAPSVFRKRHRLTHARQFRAVFDNKIRKSRGAITVFLLPTDQPDHRLGLSIGRRVGGAVSRNRVKRQVREAFRLSLARLPSPPGGSYDVVVSARAHRRTRTQTVLEWLTDAVGAAHAEQQQRLSKASTPGGNPDV